MRRLVLLVSVLGALGVVAISGVPVFGADNGTVSATVSVQDVPCITIGTTTINYGTKAFSTSLTFSSATGSIGNIASCSGAAQTLFAKGTDASATGATWQLTDLNYSCATPELNVFKHSVAGVQGGTVALASATSKQLGSLTANQAAFSLGTTLLMPCAGSAGGGKTMSTSILLTATVP